MFTLNKKRVKNKIIIISCTCGYLKILKIPGENFVIQI